MAETNDHTPSLPSLLPDQSYFQKKQPPCVPHPGLASAAQHSGGTCHLPAHLADVQPPPQTKGPSSENTDADPG